MSSDQVQNPVFNRATHAKRLTDIELGAKDHKYIKYDSHVSEMRNETAEEFAARKEKFGISTVEDLITELVKKFFSEYVLLFVGVSTIVGACFTLFDYQEYKDLNGVILEKCIQDELGNIIVPEQSSLSFLLSGVYLVLVFSVLIKIFSDCGKQIVYYELFTYGALVDFENTKRPYFTYCLVIMSAFILYFLYHVDEDIAPSAVKQTLTISLISQVWGLHGKHSELRNRESNILCVNKVFEQHHSLARHHMQNLTVIPFRVVKLVIGKVLMQKTEGDELLRRLFQGYLDQIRKIGDGIMAGLTRRP